MNKIIAMNGAKANIFITGEAGESHTVDYAARGILKDLSNVEKELLISVDKLIPTDEIWCLASNEKGQLEVCKIIDINN